VVSHVSYYYVFNVLEDIPHVTLHRLTPCRNEVRQYHIEPQKVATEVSFRRDPDWSLGKFARVAAVKEIMDGDTTSRALQRPVSKVRYGGMVL
jgi:hypothetical protein